MKAMARAPIVFGVIAMVGSIVMALTSDPRRRLLHRGRGSGSQVGIPLGSEFSVRGSAGRMLSPVSPVFPTAPREFFALGVFVSHFGVFFHQLPSSTPEVVIVVHRDLQVV